ncbi:uncharacterized protein DUF4124 [Thiogranum longum]|uniref:Uncharacterized protein DUF4124 n=1 Tax=Thiogranum longum TaxID=1537524 RepID=A0A4R1HM06_9GAMM|nr:DUF4124 domain-containing protein [Thiogranum longum]TCK18252.1 uncharacterized protein DUF4124 [Thiogranum longum]
MKPDKHLIAAILSALLTLVAGVACGSEIYKWTGDDGVTHYAEAPPETSFSSLEILDVSVPEPAPPATTIYQPVLDVANSIEASRLERERARLERKKILLQERELQQSQLAAQPSYYRNNAVGPAYYPPRYRYPPRPYPPGYWRYPMPTPHQGGDRPGRDGGSARAFFNR